jgi:ppGpp synthetase/RelA/SpoT-type nucleotidyltranferase
MDFEEFKANGQKTYDEMSRLVRKIVEDAVAADNAAPRVQAFQNRPKGIGSLKRKLTNRGIADSSTIQDQIKDLAGVRVVLYTNLELDQFLQKRYIVQSLDVHWDETKAHHPTDENGRTKYEGFHYIVGLSEAMLAQPEYEKFKGLRCEIQIQTLLAHAWAESSHDIIYKGDDTPGFGSKIASSLRDRLNKIMDDQLKPAGYELDKVRADYLRLEQGKELFRREAFSTLKDAPDNNVRFQELKGIADHLIPNYDDIPSVFPEIRRAVKEAIIAARGVLTKDIETPEGNYGGFSVKLVTDAALDIYANYRYADIEGAFGDLIDLSRSEEDTDIRKRIIEICKKLAAFNLHAWKQVGPYVQVVLAEALATYSKEEILAIRPIALAVWRELLGTEIDGSVMSSMDTITISKGAVPASADLQGIRDRAMSGLFTLLDAGEDDAQKSSAISALWHASQLPSGARYSNEMLGIALADLTKIIGGLALRTDSFSFPLLQSIESHAYREYSRFRGLADAPDDKMGCKSHAQALVTAIDAMRRKFSRKRGFVRFKTLVGFDGVFAEHWAGKEPGYVELEAQRKRRAAEFVERINDQNTEEWIKFTKKCAETKSNDGATFPIFGEFIRILGEKRPRVALMLIEQADDDVMGFLPALLAGLSRSEMRKEYADTVSKLTSSGKRLLSVARHYRIAEKKEEIAAVEIVLKAALSAKDTVAVVECLVYAVEAVAECGKDGIERLFMPALAYLTANKDARWIRVAWFLPQMRPFSDLLTEEQAVAILENLRFATKIDHEAEYVLAALARRFPGPVWRLFAGRLLVKEDIEGEYEAVPYKLHTLDKVLQADAAAAVNEIRSWYKPGDNMFQFTGGRLLKAIFDTCDENLAKALQALAKKGGTDNFEFIIRALNNYQGEATIHPVVQEIVAQQGEDHTLWNRLEIILENTGVVSGAFGFVDAMRERKARMHPWLEDARAPVKAFGDYCIRRLDNRVASEQRTAEMREEMRKRDFEG